MKHKTKAILALTAAATLSVAIISLSPNRRIGPANLYPDLSLTPGLVATSDFSELTAITNGLTYSKNHRQTSATLKAQIHQEYPNCPAPNEIDHYIPLALGGADDAKNLWCESDTLTWNGINYGFKVKDTLENYLVIQMKNGSISPQNAQDCIKTDWVACYLKFKEAIGGTVKFGSINLPQNYDGEDELN